MTETLYRMETLPDGVIQYVPVTVSSPPKMLTVDWVGQNTIRRDDDFTNSDCGSAVVTSWLHYRGVTAVSVDDVSRATGKQPGFTYTVFADLDRAANRYGLDLQHEYGTLTLPLMQREIDAGRPVIALVHYPTLPRTFDPTYRLSHWILIVGYDPEKFYYHDPYWPSADRGASIPIDYQQLQEALLNVKLNGNTAFQGAIEKIAA